MCVLKYRYIILEIPPPLCAYTTNSANARIPVRAETKEQHRKVNTILKIFSST